MVCYYLKKECVLFLEFIVLDDMYKYGFIYYFFVYLFRRWKYLYFVRKKNMIFLLREIVI